MNFSLSLSVSFLSSLIHSASLIIFLILRFVCSWHNFLQENQNFSSPTNIGDTAIILIFLATCVQVNRSTPTTSAATLLIFFQNSLIFSTNVQQLVSVALLRYSLLAAQDVRCEYQTRLSRIFKKFERKYQVVNFTSGSKT